MTIINRSVILNLLFLAMCGFGGRHCTKGVSADLSPCARDSSPGLRGRNVSGCQTPRLRAVSYSAAPPTNSARLRFRPEKPRPGGSMTVIYDPRRGPLRSARGLKLVYGFSMWQTTDGHHRQIALRRNGRMLEARLALPAEAVYLWCFVRSDTQRDLNDGSIWDTYLYGVDGNPVRGSREERASMIMAKKIEVGEKEPKA